ncbi:MAG: type III-A CRISPR-associated RAMP protein Csm5 [Armatimonadota bacterium]|nr:type III-A CRISPR-associated RAMP protein Csm5 [Armatimonadota bacterium]
MQLEAKSITPVHIGSGDSLSPMDYWCEEGRVHVCDTPGLMRRFGDRFADWIMARERPTLQEWVDNVADGNERLRGALEENTLYSVRHAGQPPVRDDVAQYIVDGDRVTLPGSSVKGAIRTAVLYCIVADNAGGVGAWLAGKLEPLVERDRLGPGALSGLAKELERRALHARRRKNMQYDLLKYLRVPDLVGPERGDGLFVANVELHGTTREFHMFAELLGSREFVGSGFSTLEAGAEDADLVSQAMRIPDGQREYVGDWPALARCCHRFAQSLIEADRRWFQQAGMDDTVRVLNRLARHNEPESPLIRVGAHTGYLSQTVGAALGEAGADGDLYQQVLAPAMSRRGSSDFPKTRRVVAGVPLGWVKLSCAEG